jgi:hypothetical protein
MLLLLTMRCRNGWQLFLVAARIGRLGAEATNAEAAEIKDVASKPCFARSRQSCPPRRPILPQTSLQMRVFLEWSRGDSNP